MKEFSFVDPPPSYLPKTLEDHIFSPDVDMFVDFLQESILCADEGNTPINFHETFFFCLIFAVICLSHFVNFDCCVAS